MHETARCSDSQQHQKMEEGLIIRSLEVPDAPRLSTLLCSQSLAYMRFFTPFDFEQESIVRLLDEREKDVWMGFNWQGSLLGFFMLRGWDEGYGVPTYGVCIDETFSGYGFASLSLKIAKSVGRLRRSPRLMLKVHPENLAARTLFERAKFKLTGVHAESSNLIYHCDLPGIATKV